MRRIVTLAATAGLVASLAGLPAVTAQAQQTPAHATPAATATTTTMKPLRSLDAEQRPAHTSQWMVSDPVAYRQAAKSKDWVQTPSGLSYRSCVYHAPNHAVVRTNEIVAPSGAVQRITPCRHPMLLKSGPAAPRALATPATAAVKPANVGCGFGKGGVWWAVSCNESQPEWITTFNQKYAVPSNPAQDGALIFLWGGLENMSGNSLIQDVLTWGANGSITNPNIWYVTNWYLWPGNNSVTSPSMHVNPVDTINANLTASKCSGTGACTWLLQSTDPNTGGSVSLTVGSDAVFDLLLGAVFESPRANGCIETPADGHAAFRNLTVVGNDGAYTPSFGVSTPDSQCSIKITQTATSGDINWKP